ncbi:MAG: VOC family protein [Gaiellaceae bacterium]
MFDHVHLRVRDLEASRRFYAAVLRPLGFPLTTENAELVESVHSA